MAFRFASKFNKKTLSLSFLVMAVSSSNAFAKESVSALPHVHGVGELNLVLEQNQIQLALISPAVNIIGFEHPPQTTAQKASVINAKQQLMLAHQLFDFNARDCQLKQAKADFGIMESSLKPAKQIPVHNLHNDNHHSEITANYHFICSGTQKITAITVKLFEHFEHIEHLKVQWISPFTQGRAEVSAQNNQLILK